LKLKLNGPSALSRYSKQTPAQVETELVCAPRSVLARSVKLTNRIRSSGLTVPHSNVMGLQVQRLQYNHAAHGALPNAPDFTIRGTKNVPAQASANDLTAGPKQADRQIEKLGRTTTMQLSTHSRVDHVHMMSYPANIAPRSRVFYLLFVAIPSTQGPPDRAAQIATAPPVCLKTLKIFLTMYRSGLPVRLIRSRKMLKWSNDMMHQREYQRHKPGCVIGTNQTAHIGTNRLDEVLCAASCV
jgi:hypothetical protein